MKKKELKTVLVTGGACGIGREISTAFSKLGYNIAVNYNKSQNAALDLIENITKNGGKAKAYRADISNSEDVDKMKDAVCGDFGRVDILVNNAGISRQALFTDITESEWDEIFNVNVKGTFLTTKAFLPKMVSDKCGRIINISSVLGITGASCEVHYSASKAAVIGFTKALAKEVGLSGVTVNAVAPGFIDTKMNANVEEDIKNQIKDKTPLNKLGNARDVAAAVLYLASDAASFVTGQIISVDGGLFSL